jgi:hypothetical protein
LQTLLPLLSCPDTAYYSLQTPLPFGDAERLGAHDIIDLEPELTDYARTAALIAQLDLVITVDTSVAHLSGALGKPVWVLLGQHCDWRWLIGRTESPWYPGMRLFHQTQPGDWAGLIEEVIQVLDDVAS